MSNTAKDVFISYSTKDEETVLYIRDKIEKSGCTCFFAPRDIHAGKEYAEELVNGIDGAKAFVLIMSQDANDSPHVLREVELAVRKKIPTVVYRISDVTLSKSMEYYLLTHQWIDAGAEGEAALLKFVKECKKKDTPGGKNVEPVRMEGKLSADNRKKFQISKIGIVLLTVGVICLFAGAFLAMDYGLNLGIVFDNAANAKQEGITLGDTVTLGTYNGVPIQWRVLRISEDGQKAVLVTSGIVTMKAYDAAESGTYNEDENGSYWQPGSAADSDMKLQAMVRGNNNWAESNIRVWLNSDAEVVTYSNGIPKDSAMSELANGYHLESGFLHSFTAAELAVIEDTEIVTPGNVLSEQTSITTSDKVYLLSTEELKWFETAGISVYAIPTPEAVAQDESGWYKYYTESANANEYYWWLRTPAEDSSGLCYMVDSGYGDNMLTKANAGLEGYGIRPAITVSVQALETLSD